MRRRRDAAVGGAHVPVRPSRLLLISHDLITITFHPPNGLTTSCRYVLPLSILGLLSLCFSGMLYLRPANLAVLWRMLLKVKLLVASVDLVPRLKLCAAWRLESCRPPNAHDLLTRRL